MTIKQTQKKTNLFIVGAPKCGTTSLLGLYNRAFTIQNMPSLVLARALNRVTFPLFANIQDDKDRLRNIYSKINHYTILAIAPIMVFFFLMANEIILFLLGEAWIGATIFFKFLCVIGLLQPFQIFNLNIIKSYGRSDTVLMSTLGIKFFVLAGIVLVINMGIIYLVVIQIVSAFIELSLNTHLASRHIGYNIWDFLTDVLPAKLINIVIGVIALFFTKYIVYICDIKLFMTLTTYLFAFTALYLITLKKINDTGFLYLEHRLKSLILKK